MLFWAILLGSIYVTVAAAIFISDGYFHFSKRVDDHIEGDGIMRITFFWPFFLLFILFIIPMFLRDALVNLRKKHDAKKIEEDNIRAHNKYKEKRAAAAEAKVLKEIEQELDAALLADEDEEDDRSKYQEDYFT